MRNAIKSLILFLCIIISSSSVLAFADIVGKFEIVQPNADYAIHIDQNSNFQALFIDSEATSQGIIYLNQSSSGNSLTILQSGTGSSIFIDQNGDGIGIDIDSEATGEPALRTNIPAGSSVNAVRFNNEGTGQGLFIDQNGNGIGLEIDSEATTISAMYVTGETTTGGMFEIVNNGAMTNIDGSGRRGVFSVEQSNSASTQPVYYGVNQGTGDTLRVRSNGNGHSIAIDQNGNGTGLDIDSESETGPAIDITQQTGIKTQFGRWQGNTVGSNYFYRNLDSATTASPVVFIEQDEAGDDQVGLMIQQDGSGEGIKVETLTSIPLDLDQDGTGYTIHTDSGGHGWRHVQHASGTGYFHINVYRDIGGPIVPIFQVKGNGKVFLGDTDTGLNAGTPLCIDASGWICACGTCA